MRKVLAACTLLFLLAACDLLSRTQFIGTWAGTNSVYGAVGYTFWADQTFTRNSGDSGTWDSNATTLTFIFKDGTVSTCEYMTRTVAGQSVLDLTFSDCTESLVKQD